MSKINVIVNCLYNTSNLYPLSGSNFPKPFIRVNSNYGFFHLSLLRLGNLNIDKLTILCYPSYKELVERETKKLGFRNFRIIEINTTENFLTQLIQVFTSLSYKTLYIKSNYLLNDESLLNSIIEAINLNKNTIIGIAPTFPKTKYNYLKYTNNEILEYLERPNIKDITHLLENDSFLMDAEIYIIDKIDATGPNDSVISLLGDRKNIGVIRYTGYFNDMDSFLDLYECLPKDTNNNVILGDKNVVSHETSGSLIYSKKKTFLLGLNDIAIIDTPDALLISSLDHCNYIEELVKDKNKKLDQYGEWGDKKLICRENDKYTIFRFTIYPKMSVNLSNKGSITIIQGLGNLIMNENNTILKECNTKNISKPCEIENLGNDNLEFLGVFLDK